MGLTQPASLTPLYRIQKKVIRAISFSDKYASSSPLFQRLEILKVNELHTFNLLCFVFQCNQNTSIGLFQNYFVPLTSAHDYNTRKASKDDVYFSCMVKYCQIYRCNTMEQFEDQYKAQSLFKRF